MQQGFFRDAEAAGGAQDDPLKLGNLTVDDTFFLDGYDVFWRRVADQYEGAMKPKSCVFGEEADVRYSVHNLILSATKYWRVDSTFRVSDDSLYLGYPVDRPYRMRRAKIFECEVTFRNEDGSAARSIAGIRMHSQGGMVWFDPDADGEVYGIRMRDKEYPYYSEWPDFLLFSLHKQGQIRMAGYA